MSEGCTEQQVVSSLHALHPDLIVEICKYLSITDVLRFTQIDQLFHRQYHDSQGLWKLLLHKRWKHYVIFATTNPHLCRLFPPMP
jgi:hypothetical protein